MSNDPTTDAGTLPDEQEKKPSFLGRIGNLLRNRPKEVAIAPTVTPTVLKGNFRIDSTVQPFVLTLGNVRLEFHPDLSITGEDSGNKLEWIVYADRAPEEGVPKFLRIKSQETVLFGRVSDMQSDLFGFDKSVAGRHVKISNVKGRLKVQLLELERPTSISSADPRPPLWKTRGEHLRRLPSVLGRPLVQFDDEEALGVIREVNAILAAEVYRDLDDDGYPGGVIEFPDEMAVIVLGDLHARVDNVLRVISEGGVLTALERREVCLVFLGDLVHSEEKGELEDMESTILILDLFCMLKRRFPENIFYIRGNHESFSPSVGKSGVPQGLLLSKKLKKRRGNDYVSEIETLFNGLAYIIHGNNFAACHGAPVRSRVTRNTLVNIRRYPGLQAEIVWNRLRQGNRPVGYGKGSVKRFRQMLNLSKHATLLVGHTPMSTIDTTWRDIGGIKGHHIIYSAHSHRMAAMVIQDGHVTQLEFIPDQALAFLSDTQQAQGDSWDRSPGPSVEAT